MGALAAETVGAAELKERERIQLRIEETAEPLMVLGERSLIAVLLRNLLENALRYSPPEAPILVDVSRDGGGVLTRIADAGPGIPEQVRDRVFDRFFRLEASRSRETGGVGLGLAIAQAIAHVHDTRVDLRQGSEGGTAASFVLPRASAPDAGAVREGVSPVASRDS
jgi:signal transduction histidine kinase